MTAMTTVFKNLQCATTKQIPFEADWILNPPVFKNKKSMVLIRQATFGSNRTPKNSLKHKANVISITGIELDYDTKNIPHKDQYSYARMRDKIVELGVEAFIYTSPSYEPGVTENWRVILPFSQPFESNLRAMEAYHEAAVQITERWFGMPFPTEVHRIAQHYYIGRVGGREYESDHIKGAFLDQIEDPLDTAFGFLNGAGGGAKMDMEATTQAIAQGDNYHNSILSILGHYASKGVAIDQAILAAQGHMLLVQQRRDEWQERFDNIPRAAEWVYSKEGQKAPGTGADSLVGTDVLGLNSLNAFELTEEDVRNIKESKFIYKSMIVRGHLIGIMGEPGAGKTTIMEYISWQLPGTVYYVNGDISAGDMPEARRRAIAGGYKLLCPDAKTGKSMAGVVEVLRGIAASGADLSGVTFVIDTLKKIAEVIRKSDARAIYQLLRSLTGQGATVICLGHCNKYRDAEGWPIYEGTADLRSDFDELALLHPMMLDYGQVVTSLYWKEDGVPWGKSRAETAALSWNMDLAHGAREVTELEDWVDTIELGKQKREAKKLDHVNAAIAGYILSRNEPPGMKEIYTNTSHPVRISRQALEAGTGKYWEVTIGPSNKKMHHLLPDGEKLATRDARGLLGKND